MRFWDASAIVPLCVVEDATRKIRELLARDPHMAVWWGTPLETASAFARLRRTGSMSVNEEQAARRVVASYRDSWTELQPTSTLREQAMRMLSVHDLRCADSLQLAAAVAWSAGIMSGREFVCLDGRLAEAATREGFSVRP